MIIDNDPPITRYISVPRDMNQLNCSSLTAGIVEAVLDGLGFVSSQYVHLRHLAERIYLFHQPARVTAHSTPTDALPSRTTILIKLDKPVADKE